MNLKDLSNIDIKDLKNIDWSQAKNQLQSRPDLLINIFLIVVTLAVTFSTYKKHIRTAKLSKSKIEVLQKKTVALDRFEATEKRYKNFLRNTPKAITGNQLIETLSRFAIKRNIQILSFSPAKEKTNKLINLTSVEINVISENYADIILFMRDIESSSYPIRVERWSGTSVMQDGVTKRRSQRSARRLSRNDSEKKYIKAIIKIGSVEFKNG